MLQNKTNYSKLGGWLTVIFVLDILQIVRLIPAIVFTVIPLNSNDIFYYASLAIFPLTICAILSIAFLLSRKKVLFFMFTVLIYISNIASGLVLTSFGTDSSLLAVVVNNLIVIIALIIYSVRSVRVNNYFGHEK